MIVCRVLLVLALVAAPQALVRAGELEEIAASALVGEPFLALVADAGIAALCADPQVRGCFDVTADRCPRLLGRSETRCVDLIRRVMKIAGADDDRLNAALFADYAQCVVDGAAMVRLLDPAGARACLVAGSRDFAALVARQSGGD